MGNLLRSEPIRIYLKFGILLFLLTSYAQASPVYHHIRNIAIFADSADILQTRDSEVLLNNDKDVIESDHKQGFPALSSIAVEMNTFDTDIADMGINSDIGFLTKVFDADNDVEYEVSDRKSIDLFQKDRDTDLYSVQSFYQQSLSEKAEIHFLGEEIPITFDLADPVSDMDSDSIGMRIFTFIIEGIDSVIDKISCGFQKIFGNNSDENDSRKKQER